MEMGQGGRLTGVVCKAPETIDQAYLDDGSRKCAGREAIVSMTSSARETWGKTDKILQLKRTTRPTFWRVGICKDQNIKLGMTARYRSVKVLKAAEKTVSEAKLWGTPRVDARGRSKPN